MDIIEAFIRDNMAPEDVTLADMHDLPFEDGEFDWVFNTQTLEHAYDLEKAVDETLRVADFGAFLGLPCESRTSYDKNPSHYSYMRNSFDWIKEIQRPGWFLMQSVMHRCYINVILVREEHVYDD